MLIKTDGGTQCIEVNKCLNSGVVLHSSLGRLSVKCPFRTEHGIFYG